MVKEIEAVVWEAGNMILTAHLDNQKVHQKVDPSNYVTDYDVKIRQFLINHLTEILPGCSFFGEEDPAENEKSVGTGDTFFIDPIDGTTNFMLDYRNSFVSIGVSQECAMIAGWVYNPYADQMYSAWRGRGAFLNGRKLEVEDKGLCSEICAFGCARYNAGGGIFRILENLFLRSLSIRNGGSSAIDLCQIASGSNVAYIEMFLQPYDYAAAAVIVSEAGGVITMANDEPITLDHGWSIVAGTPAAAREIIELIHALPHDYYE